MASKKDYKEIKDEGQRSVEQLEQDLQVLSDTVEKFLKSGAEDSKEQLDELREEAGSRLAAVKERLSSYSDEVKHRLKAGQESLQEHGKDALDCADTYVHENPWKGIGIAAAAGLFVGLLIGRR